MGVLAVGATVVAGFGPSVLSPLVVGVIAGAVVANCIELPSRFEPGIAFCARTILRAGLVLLGLRLSLGDLGALGVRGLGVVAGVVTVTFLGTQWLARRMGVDDRLGLLIATGYSICGASAIAAMDGVVDADEEETAYAIALVTLCGSLSIIVLPSIASAVDLTGAAFGTWVGAAVHDVGQVVATAGTGGSEALAAATVVKLTRVVLLAPLVAIVALRRRPVRVGPSDETERPPLVPLFVVGFLVAVLVRSAGLLGPNALTLGADLEKIALTVALVALGLGVRIDRLRRLSGRPLALGMAAWVLVAGAAFVGTSIAV
ncbi:putative integral membrane protein (TIGR00698 family) [Ilumatobacter fluminis]|uniref:Putative integral membrane protein (TIGR00698 family) n=1 Tax=Ilumatobacter fluminis TaxID=467091 RepID=A0A4R7HVS3_9ACTN|nr:putative sulfate exporter family transporter [Ilumatobacter fluminis]TDT14955.1 putative integral membrane protein (TIGR00698 family) [Ilumatobacter fluminis]